MEDPALAHDGRFEPAKGKISTALVKRFRVVVLRPANGKSCIPSTTAIGFRSKMTPLRGFDGWKMMLFQGL